MPFQAAAGVRTGEVHGERPNSWVKITLFVLALVAVALAAWGIVAALAP